MTQSAIIDIAPSGFIFLALLFLLGLGAAVLARWFVIKRGILDQPTARGLATTVVPRGGGLSIVLFGLLGSVAAFLFGMIDAAHLAVFGGLGLLIAGVGFVDDMRDLSAKTRLGAQVLAAGGAVGLLGGAPAGPMEWLSAGVWTFVMIWFINAYNFMDGLDGLAGTQALFASLVGAAVLLSLGWGGPALILIFVAAAAAGFLVLNTHPASVYMGDASSTYLGFFFGAMAYATQDTGAAPPFWICLLSFFLADALTTLISRLSKGHKMTTPHRTHAYQLFTSWQVRAGSKAPHAKVASVFGLLLLGLALPISLAVVSGEPSEAWGIALGWLGLLCAGVAISRRILMRSEP